VKKAVKAAKTISAKTISAKNDLGEDACQEGGGKKVSRGASGKPSKTTKTTKHRSAPQETSGIAESPSVILTVVETEIIETVELEKARSLPLSTPPPTKILHHDRDRLSQRQSAYRSRLRGRSRPTRWRASSGSTARTCSS